MPRRIVKDKKELYQELKSFFGEEQAKKLIGGIAKELERRHTVVLNILSEDPLVISGPTKQSRAKERRRMYAMRKRGNKNKSTKGKGGANA